MRVAIAALAVSCLLLSCGRNGAFVPVPEGQKNPGELTGAPQYEPAQGFVVHEWGTLTSVVASDGSTLPGLHHEEEDLPPFVADRLKQAQVTPGVVQPIGQKMETPVTYFYSPVPVKVSARVDFPNGMLTQWYPFVQTMSPPLYWHNGSTPVDLHLNGSLTDWVECARFNEPLKDGSLDWGTFDVLAPEQTPELAGPIGNTTWGFARNTKANTLAIGTQREKFLFYRGLGNFQLPVTAKVFGQQATFTNPAGEEKVPAVFLMQVTASGAGFVELGGVAGGAQLSGEIPAASMGLAEFVDALKIRLTAVLVADGLYADEAKAMVDTWERSYFLTPGIRALYLLPQSVTDEVIPLHITPAPKVLRRSMVIRLELLTPSHEQELSQWLTELSQSPTAGAATVKFLSLGRFAEPHLSRAVAMAKDAGEKAAGEALLVKIRPQRKWAPTAAE
jgi:hypothetical protein